MWSPKKPKNFYGAFGQLEASQVPKASSTTTPASCKAGVTDSPPRSKFTGRAELPLPGGAGRKRSGRPNFRRPTSGFRPCAAAGPRLPGEPRMRGSPRSPSHFRCLPGPISGVRPPSALPPPPPPPRCCPGPAACPGPSAARFPLCRRYGSAEPGLPAPEAGRPAGTGQQQG